MSNNGKQATGPIIYRVLSDSGVEIDVSPLSPLATTKLREKSRDLFPPPDEEQFRKPVPNAAQENDTFIDHHDPEYVRLRSDAIRQQAEYLIHAIASTSLSFPRGKDQLIEDFRPKLDELRKLIDLPEDEWEATFWYGIVSSAGDHEAITMAAMSSLPLTEQEVIEGEHGLRVFRYRVQGKRPSQLAAGFVKLAQGLAKGAKGDA